MFINIVISVEDCFEILVVIKALFLASGFRHNFEMAHSGGVVDRDFLIFAHGVIDITGKDNFLPFLVNLNHSKAAWLGAARVHDAAAQALDPMLSLIPSRMQKERCARDVLWLQHVRQRADTTYLAIKYS